MIFYVFLSFKVCCSVFVRVANRQEQFIRIIPSATETQPSSIFFGVDIDVTDVTKHNHMFHAFQTTISAHRLQASSTINTTPETVFVPICY